MKSIRVGVSHALFLFTLIVGAMSAALAQVPETYRASSIVIEAPWSRATPGGAKVAGGCMRIANTGSESDRLVGGSTVVAERFEVHRSTVTGGVARMEPVTGGLEIGPGQTVELKPGTLHAMFVDLKQALKPGDAVKGMLMFEKAGVLKVEYHVSGIGAQAAPPPNTATEVLRMSTLGIIRWSAWALVAVAIFVATGIAVGWLRTEWLGQRPPVAVTTTGTPAIGGPFSLVNHRGERMIQETFKGKPTAYFFGFTNCPEVCPTTLFEMTQRLQELGPDADRLNVVFVTVDPERDTPDLLKIYLESFDPRIVALTGTPEELAVAAKAFRITYHKVPSDVGYTMEHTASVILTDAQGELVTLIDYHEDPVAALAKLRRALRS